MKSLIIFDLDGTLAESKSSLDAEMAALLGRLLEVVKIAIISGGAWPQYEQQVLSHLPRGDILKQLSLLPTCGTKILSVRRSLATALFRRLQHRRETEHH